MANKRRLNYEIGVTADTSQLNSLKQAIKTLQEVGNSPLKGTTDEIQRAKTAAIELSQHLRTAFNQDTGKLDLITFNNNLKKSGQTLNSYYDMIQKGSIKGQEAFLQMAQAITRAELPLKRTNKLASDLWITMKNTVRWQVTTSALRGFVGSFQTAHGFAKDLDRSLNSIRIVTGDSAEEMRSFAKEANEAAKALSSTTVDYTDASLIYYQQGLDDQQVKGRTDTTIKLANVANESAETASEQLTAIWNNFYDGSKSLEYYADVMVALGANTASSSAEIAAGIQKFAAVAGTVGLSYEYAAAALATLTANTREAPEVIGNSLKTLFARLQGLTLGETLEDGVNLNKYSKALQAVGVNILDSNNNIKDMNTLLNETAAKWDTITGAQKLALAQTVAGVRQYNQFVSLMDSWGDFQENLNIALGSEGSLEEQAEIYSESWEAARDRVRASAEAIYDSLVDENFFIGLDDGLSTVLNRVNDVVNGLGGMSGVLTTVSSLMFMVYGDKMASSIRSIVENIGIGVGYEQARARAFQQSAAEIISTMDVEKGSEILAQNRVNMTKEIVSYQQAMNRAMDHMTESERQATISLQDNVKLLERQYDLTYATAQKSTEKANNIATNIYEKQLFSDFSGAFEGGKLAKSKKDSLRSVGAWDDNSHASNINKLASALDSLLLKTSEAAKEQERLNILYKEYNREGSLIRGNSEEFKKFAKSIGLSTENMEKLVNSSHKGADIFKMISNSNQDLQKLSLVMSEVFKIPIEQADKLAVAMRESARDTENNRQALENYRNAADKAVLSVQNLAKGARYFADKIVLGGQVLTQMGMLVSSIRSLRETLNEDSLDGAERFTRIFISLGMILPGAISLLDKFTKVKLIENAATAISNKLLTVNATTTERSIIGKKLYKIASMGVAEAETAEGAALVATNAALITKMALVAGIVVAIAALTAAIIWYTGQEKRAKNAIQKTSKAYEEEKEKLKELKDELKTTQDRIDELNSQDTLTLVEQEELEKLERQNRLLTQQKEIQEALVDLKQEEYIETAEDRRADAAKWRDEFPNYEKYRKQRLDEIERNNSRKDPIIGMASGVSEDQLQLDYAAKLQQQRAEHIDDLNAAEETYQAFLDRYEAGALSEERLLAQLEDLTKTRKFMFDEADYQELYIKPIIDDSEIKDLYKDFALTGKINISKELDKELKRAGVSVADFSKHIADTVTRAQEKVGSFLSDEQAGRFFDKLSDEDIKLIADLQIDEEKITTFEDFYRLFLEAKSNNQLSFFIDFEEAISTAKDALATIAEGEFLEDTTIKTLQEKFASIYDLSNLDGFSLYDQARLVGEALISATDPAILNDRLEILNGNLRESLDDYRTQLDEIASAKESIVKELGFNTDLSKEQINDLKNDLQDLTEKEIEIDVDIDDAEKKLQELNKFEMDPIQVEIEDSYLDAMLAQMGAVEKAASLIGEGFKVAADDAEELMRTLPELFEDAVISAKDGTIQLSQDIVNAVAQAAQEEVMIRGRSLEQILNDRYNKAQEEVDILNNVKNIAIQCSDDTHWKEVLNSQLTEEEKQRAAKSIVLARLQQKVQENTASNNTRNVAIADQNKVTTVSATEGKATAENWEQAANMIQEALHKAFIRASKDQQDLAAGIAISETVADINVVGKFKNGSSTFDTDLPSDDPYKAVRDYVNNEGKLGNYNDSIGGQIQKENDIKDIQKYMGEWLGMDVSAGQIINGDFWDSYMNSVSTPREFLNDVSRADNFRTYQLAVAGNDLAQYYGAMGAGEALKNSGLKKGKKEKEPKEGKTYDSEDQKDLKDAEDRYHEINRQIERQNDLLDDISNNVERAYGGDKLKGFKKQTEALNDQLTNYNTKLKEAQGYLAKDTDAIKALFPNAQIDEKGEITNYQELLAQNVQDYNSFISGEYQGYLDQLNALAGDSEAQEEFRKQNEEYWEGKRKEAEELYKEREDALKQYESTIDEIRTVTDQIEEVQREMADVRLSKIEYKLEIVLDLKGMKDALRDFKTETMETFGDYLTHGFGKMSENLNIEEIAKQQAQAESKLLPDYTVQYNDLLAEYNSADTQVDRDRIIADIKELQGNVLDSASAMVDWANSIEEIVPKAVEAAAARYEEFTNQLEHNDTVLQTIRELYTLQGVTYKTQDGFNKLQRNSQERLNTQLAQAELQKKWFDNAQANYLQAQAALDAFKGGEDDPQYDMLKKARDAYLAEFNESQEAYLALAKDAMETAQQMYLDQIEKAAYDFGQVVSDGIGLDLLQDKYDHYIEEDERYFDKVNEAYETTAWFNKLQADIDKTTNEATKNRLKQLQDEINVRREGNKLSQYDLDILNAKYEVLKAQIALEDAQNAKNNIELVRDRQGNWNYQFTADPAQVEGAEQDLLDAENEWYNIAKQQVNDVTGEIISTWAECQEKIKEIYSDMTLTDEERTDRAAEIYSYYTEKIKFLEEEKQVSIQDMTEAGNALLFATAVQMGDDLADLTGMTSQDIKDLVAAGGEDIIGLLTADSETIKNVIASNTGLIDLFDNVYAKDLANMTSNTDHFEDFLDKALDQCRTHFNNYGDTVNNVGIRTGTSLGFLEQETDNVSISTDILREAGLDAADSLDSMMDYAMDLASGYSELSLEIWGTVEALYALADAQAGFVQSQTPVSGGVEFDPDKDYAQEIQDRLSAGASMDDADIKQLIKEREAKIDWLEDQGVGSDYWDFRFIDYEAEMNNLRDKGFSDFSDEIRELNSLRNEKIDFLQSAGVDSSYWETKHDYGEPDGSSSDGSSVLEKLAYKDSLFNKMSQAMMNATAIVTGNNTIPVISDNIAAIVRLLEDKLDIPNLNELFSNKNTNITIEKIEFPNITDPAGLEEAFLSLPDKAAQRAQQKN